MEQQIREKLNELRAMLQADGGDLELVSIEGRNVKVKLTGACGGCPHATMTIKRGIEQALRDSVHPQITVEKV